MKPRISNINLLLILMFALLMASCSSHPASPAIKSLRGFYESYIHQCSKVPADGSKIAALKQDHCTPKLLASIDGEEVDADPFLNAQDVDSKWAESLEIEEIGSVPNFFRVCYTSSHSDQRQCVKVAMIEDSGKWKIDSLAY